MLRWANAHKAGAVGIVVGAALLVGGLLARTSNTAAVDASPTTSTITAAPSTTAAAAGVGSPPPADAPVVDDPARLDFPSDPSAARQDRSAAGVRQVGLDYLGTVQQRFLYLSPAAGLDLLEAWQADGVTDAELARTVERFANLRSMLTSAGGAVWWLVSPLAVRVDAFDRDRARVTVWTVSVTASGADPATGGEVVVPIVDYRTSTVELLWSDGPGWSVWDVTDVAGPVPMLAPGSVQSAPAEFIDRLGGFSLVKEHR